MLDELRERITTYLSQNRLGVISTSGNLGAWSVTARYENRGLELDCHVPRWSDAIYHLEQDPHLLVTILDGVPDSARWMQYRGIAQIDSSTVNERYVAIHVAPERIDLIDEKLGYGKRETLDF